MVPNLAMSLICRMAARKSIHVLKGAAAVIKLGARGVAAGATGTPDGDSPGNSPRTAAGSASNAPPGTPAGPGQSTLRSLPSKLHADAVPQGSSSTAATAVRFAGVDATGIAAGSSSSNEASGSSNSWWEGTGFDPGSLIAMYKPLAVAFAAASSAAAGNRRPLVQSSNGDGGPISGSGGMIRRDGVSADASKGTSNRGMSSSGRVGSSARRRTTANQQQGQRAPGSRVASASGGMRKEGNVRPGSAAGDMASRASTPPGGVMRSGSGAGASAGGSGAKGKGSKSSKKSSKRPGSALPAAAVVLEEVKGAQQRLELLLVVLLIAGSGAELGARVAGFSDKVTAAVLVLLGGMPGGAAAVARCLECLSPVVAAK